MVMGVVMCVNGAGLGGGVCVGGGGGGGGMAYCVCM